MNIKTPWLLIILVAVAGHFMDGWSYPPHTTVLGWWFWHAINWLRRDLVLVFLLWPRIMWRKRVFEIQSATIYGMQTNYRYEDYYTTLEKIAWWTLAAVANFMLHHGLYWLGLNTRGILQ